MTEQASHAEKTRYLYEGLPATVVVSIGAAAILALIHLPVLPAPVLLGWFGLILLVTLLRGGLWLAYRRSDTPEHPVWLRRFRAATLTAGISWGIGCTLLAQSGDLSFQAFLAFAIAGITAGAMIALATDRLSTLFLAGPMLASLAIALLMQDEALSVMAGLIVCLFLLFVFISATRIQDSFNENIRLRIQAEAQQATILDNELRWRFALEGSNQGLWDWDIPSGKTYYSPRWAMMLGHDPEEITPSFDAWTERLHPDDRDWALQYLQQHLDGLTPTYESEYRLRCKDGSYLWIVDQGQVISRDSRNRPTRMIGVHQNIHRRKEAEAALAESNRYNRALLEAMPDLMFRLSSDGHFIDWHTGQKHLLYRDPGDFLHRKLADVLPLEIAVRVRESIRRVLAENRLQFVEYALDVSGDRRTFEARLVKLNDREVMAVIRDVTEQKQASERIAQMAFYDTLTQLPNRRMLLDRLEKALVSSKRSGQHGALLFLDLDRFKALNDTYGHVTGDLLLQQVGERLRGCVREADTVARLGGDEFVVMVENLGPAAEEALGLARDISDKISTAMSRPYVLNALEHVVTPSIGISLFNGDAGGTDEVLHQADMAMYESKRQGRNGMSVFEPTMQSSLKSRSVMAHELHQAMSHRHLTLHYQPQYDLAGRVLAAEALLRWQHPRQGLIRAARMIPVAEESGLILSIGQWVMEQGFRDLQRWSEHREWSNVVLAINLSPRQFRQPGLETEIMRLLDETGADPRHIRLEINEDCLDGNMGEAIARMQRLRVRGLRFSLDDFGIGTLSFGDLRRLPLDQLKIHESFLHRALDHEDDASLMRAALLLGEGLGLEVLAEGVETPAQKAFLEQMGYRAFQGYLFAQPMNWGELMGLPTADSS